MSVQVNEVSSSSSNRTVVVDQNARPNTDAPIQDETISSTIPFTDRNVIAALERLVEDVWESGSTLYDYAMASNNGDTDTESD